MKVGFRSILQPKALPKIVQLWAVTIVLSGRHAMNKIKYLASAALGNRTCRLLTCCGQTPGQACAVPCDKLGRQAGAIIRSRYLMREASFLAKITIIPSDCSVLESMLWNALTSTYSLTPCPSGTSARAALCACFAEVLTHFGTPADIRVVIHVHDEHHVPAAPFPDLFTSFQDIANSFFTLRGFISPARVLFLVCQRDL